MTTPLLELRGVQKTFGEIVAVDIEHLTIDPGEMVSILGASGCGKSTLLRLCAGLEQPDTGTILLNGKDITTTRPERRPVNMVFQSYALFPHMTVVDNIAYGLRVTGLPAKIVTERTKQAIDLVQINGLEKRKPDQLSGGQQQRTALARALVMQPKALLLDEPLSALDANLREQMRNHLCELQATLGIAFVLVTHDQAEALALSHRLAFMDAGKIIQIDTPENIYHRPRNLTVARFIGKMFFIQAHSDGNNIISAPGLSQLNSIDRIPQAPITLGVRPESVRLSTTALAGYVTSSVTIERVEFNGASKLVSLSSPEGNRFTALLNCTDEIPAVPTVFANWRAQEMQIFDAAGTALGHHAQAK